LNGNIKMNAIGSSLNGNIKMNAIGSSLNGNIKMNAIGSSLNGNIKMNTPDSRKWKKDEYKPTIVNGNNKKTNTNCQL
jgi:hypothetical protein